MQTQVPPHQPPDALASAAAGLISRCVHCGFCNATCPTYQLLGDERDGPGLSRARIAVHRGAEDLAEDVADCCELVCVEDSAGHSEE